MNDFWIWFSTGVGHIIDINGYDHILFVSLLFFAFPLSDWKKILILITAFTVGHSVSLALSASDAIYVSQPWIEFLIALSILVSAIHQLLYLKTEAQNKSLLLYIMVLLFGLIHGMGFSFLLKAMLGKAQTIILPLLYFNLGLELGPLKLISHSSNLSSYVSSPLLL
jgi:hypothetical protein